MIPLKYRTPPARPTRSVHLIDASGQNRSTVVRRLAFALTAVLLVAGASAVVRLNKPETEQGRRWKTAPLKRGRFVKRIPTAGYIQTYQPSIMFNQCRAPERKIISILEAGTMVKEGDVVCVLDSSELEEKLRVQQGELIKARAALQQAEAQEELQTTHNYRRKSSADLRLLQAQSMLTAFRDAMSTNEIARLEGDLLVGDEYREMTEETYQHKRMLHSLGYATGNEFAAVDAELDRQQRASELARSNLRLTERYLHPRLMLQYEGQARNSQSDRRRVDMQCDLADAFVQAGTLGSQHWVAGVSTYVDYLTRSIEACTMRAPKDGEVVLLHQHHEGRFIEPGAPVHYMQNIFCVSDRSRLTLVGKVSDRLYSHIAQGNPVEIHTKSPGGHAAKPLRGKMFWLAEIPTPNEWWQPYEKHHKLQVMIHEPPEVLSGLVLGTSVTADIIGDDRSDILQVPTDALFTSDDEICVLVDVGGKLRRQAVLVGPSNDEYTEVLRGLTGTERVVTDRIAYLQELARTAEYGDLSEDHD